MGKLYDQPSTNPMATKNLPTVEQLRMAQLCDDKKDPLEIKEKCRNIVEMTKCVESVALTALHDCNGDLHQAIEKIMDGGLKDTEWITTSKKVKKSRDTSTTAHSGTVNEVGSTNQNETGGGGGHRQQPPAWNQQEGRRRPRRDRDRDRDRDRRQHQPSHNNQQQHQSRHQNGPSFNNHNNDHQQSGQQMDHWNNSMAHQNQTTGSDHLAPVVDQWNPNQPDDRHPPPVSSWDGGHADQPQQHQDARRRPRRGGGGGDHDRERDRDRDRRQQHRGAPQNGRPSGANAYQHHDQPPLQVNEWNHTDDYGEEEDWQNMKNRVFTNVKVGQHQPTQVTPQQLHHQQQPPLPNSGSGGGAGGPPSSTSSATLQTVSSGSKTVASHHQTGASPGADFGATDNAAQLGGQSIDVNMLFGQQQGQKVDAKSAAGGSWSKQATATLKNELGIGQQNVPTATSTYDHQTAGQNSHLARPPRQYSTTPKTLSSKVEMPNSEASFGQLDVEFGEFSNSAAHKMRPDATATTGASQQNYFGDFGYSGAEHGKMKDHQNQPPLVYHSQSQQQQQQRTPMKDHVTSSGATTATSSAGVMDNGVPVSADRGAPPPGYGPHPRPTGDAYQPLATSAQAPPTHKSHQQGLTSMSGQQQQQQRVFIPSSNISSSTIVDSSSIVMSQMPRSDMNIGPSVISMATTPNYSNLGYSAAMPNRNAATTTGKAQINPALYNPTMAANNASYQALAASLPYIFPTPDQGYLSALQYLSPAAAAAGYPFGALGTLPFDLSSTLNLRDAQPTMSNVSADGKTFGRADSGLLAGLGVSAGVGAPPGLATGAQQGAGPQQAQSMSDAAQQQAAAAAQLLTQAFHHPAAYPLMQTPAGPFYTPFVMPAVSNTSSSNAPSMNQYNKAANGMFPAPQPIYYGGQDLQLAQDYTKSMYGGMASLPSQPGKQQSTNATLVSGGAAGQEMAQAKAYNPAAMKMFENKAYQQQNAATPPPGMGVGGGGYATAGATQAYHGAAYAAPQFMAAAAHLLPPSMVAQHQQQGQQQAQQNSSDGQRGPNAGGGKGGVNIYANKSTGAYWGSSN